MSEDRRKMITRTLAFSLIGVNLLAQSIVRQDARLDAIVVTSEKIEKLADGFGFTEGPLWFRDGYLLFSDIPANVIYEWAPGQKVTEFRRPSGYDGSDAPKGAF